MIRVKVILPGEIPSRSHLALFCFKDARRPAGDVSFGAAVERDLKNAKKYGFTGETGQTIAVPSSSRRFERVLFIGLGPQKEADLQTIRIGAAAAVRAARAARFPSLVFQFPTVDSADRAAQAAAEGLHLGSYRFTAYKSKKDDTKPLQSVSILSTDKKRAVEDRNGVVRGTVYAESVLLARDLINTPPSDLTPEHFVRLAKKEAGGGVQVRVFDEKKIEAMRMGGLLGVNRGSAKPPYFLHFLYKPKGRAGRKVGLCGKGITFDSGGLSLKPPKAMETMKMDMSGAATVLAVFKALKTIKPPVEVHGFTPLTENMPGGNATKPGDILTARNGKTIEVLNTDAEGRLVLADALSYASEQKLDEIVDIATLTGACLVALGDDITAVMGTDRALLRKIKDASAKTGEKVWELPLEKGYESHIKSTVADMKNLGKPMQAGTIIGGIFLKEFVKKGTAWAHLDIAGTAWTDSGNSLSPAGATGSFVRTLLEYIVEN